MTSVKGHLKQTLGSCGPKLLQRWFYGKTRLKMPVFVEYETHFLIYIDMEGVAAPRMTGKTAVFNSLYNGYKDVLRLVTNGGIDANIGVVEVEFYLAIEGEYKRTWDKKARRYKDGWRRQIRHPKNKKKDGELKASAKRLRDKWLGLVGKPHQEKPDTDNLLKGFMDGLFKEDKSVYKVVASKYWAAEGGGCIKAVLWKH